MAIKRYDDCVSVFETRAAHPPTREYIDHLIAGLESSGIDALWHSAVGPRGVPLFPSQVFPVHHPAADSAVFRELVTRVHERGRTILCWYPLHLCQSLLTVHPEWRLQPYDFKNGDPAQGDAPADVTCPASPYRELLPAFLSEVTREFDFDGFWLDGTMYGLHWNTFSPGCRCDCCRARFLRDTGLDLPTPDMIDKDRLSHPTAKRWARWRYDVLMDLWQGCVTAVAAVKPSATVAFNNLRHRGHGWNLGIPLRTLGWDAVMSTETCTFPGQADVQIKLQRAYRCQRGTDTWQSLADQGYAFTPQVETLAFAQGLLAAISAGANCSPVGSEVALRHAAPTLRALHELAAPRAVYKGGTTVEYAALLASQQTEDYYLPMAARLQALHGANELCRHAHLQTSVIFDDYLDRDELAAYPVLLLGNAACLSHAQAATLTRYVQQGGVLVATHEAGTRDEWGEPHANPVLDALLGLAQRGAAVTTLTARLVDAPLRQAVGDPVTWHAPATLALPTADCRVLARVVPLGEYCNYPNPSHWDALLAAFPGARLPAGLDEDARLRCMPAALWTRTVGRGHVLYCAADAFPAYLHGATTRMARLWQHVLTTLRPPALTLRGPLCVGVNTRIQADGRWAVHVHNFPGGAYRYPQPLRTDGLFGPGDVPPVRDLELLLNGRRVRHACSGLTGAEFAVVDGTRVLLPELALHDVLLLTVE